MKRMKQSWRVSGCILLVLSMLLLLPACAQGTAPGIVGSLQNPAAPGGYASVVSLGDGFLAAGTGGRLDKIRADGEVTPLEVPTKENLLDIFHQEGLTLVCGENGTLLYSREGQPFQQSFVKETGAISQLAAFQGRFYACADKGRILVSDDGQTWTAQKIEIDSDFLGIAANEQCLMAVTRETDLLTSTDGQEWKTINFNEKYDGFYDRRTFTGICSLGDTLFIYGQMEDRPGEPYVMFTEAADVWFFKALTNINGKEFSNFMPLSIRAVGLVGDQLAAVCDKGRLLTITECTVCNQMSESEGAQWNDIAMRDGQVLLVGQDFQWKCIEETEIIQSAIGPEQARMDIQDGAAVVDVRSAEERAGGYIPGSLHIPLAELETRLPAEVPEKDQEIIFYCASGGRAQTALEQARALGYQIVYNLGGLSDWPYETEKDTSSS